MRQSTFLILILAGLAQSPRASAQFSGSFNGQPGIDLSGAWAPEPHEESTGNPAIADFLGVPINEGARAVGLAWSPSRVTVPEHQCQVHVAPYLLGGPLNLRIWEQRDNQSQNLEAIRLYISTYEQNRTIWMDDRPHPPDSAVHTWMGFSTGKWEGNTLTVYTTHLKTGYLRRNGLPESDQATLIEHFMRHGDYMVHVSEVTDPNTLTEPFVRTQIFHRVPQEGQNWLYPCESVEEVANRPRGAVPNFLPGENPFVAEFANKYKIPVVATLGGAETMYPDFQRKMKELPAIADQNKPHIRSLSHAIHAVDDLDTTLAFYRDVFGLNGMPQDFPNPAVPLLTNAPGVTLRLSMMRLPGAMMFELTHFKGLERKPARAAYTDPGAASIVFYVRDIDSAVANAKKANASIVTTGGAPVEITTAAGKARSIILRDPDGFFVQVIQEAPAPGAPEGNVHRVSLAYTMESAESTAKFYTGMMGVELSGPSTFSKDPAVLKLVGAPAGTEFRKLTGVLPGPNAHVEFTEFRGVPRTKFHLRVRDPGAPAMAIQVNNLNGMIAEMKAAGVNVISANGEIVDFGGGTHTIFVEDPNGMNLEVFERTGPPQARSQLTPVIRLQNLAHTTESLDKTLPFYRDVLGLPLNGTRDPLTQQPQKLDEDMSKFTATKGMSFRAASFHIPNAAFGFELTEFTGGPRKPVRPNIQDIGAATLALQVRDIDKVLARVKASGAPIVTIDGAPVNPTGHPSSKLREILVRDPDGFFVELQQPDPLPADTPGDILGAAVQFSIDDSAKTVAFLHDAIGFEARPTGQLGTNPVVTNLIGLPTAQWRITHGKIPGTTLDFGLIEYSGVTRAKIAAGAEDPGSPAFTMVVRDVRAAVDQWTKAGGTVATTGGQPIVRANGAGNVFVRDVNGFTWELIQSAAQ